MANLPASQWFFEVLGKRSGPYSTEHILQLHRSGQLGAGVRLIADSPDPHEITLEELIGLTQFQPPPKPEIAKDPGAHHVSPAGDPTLGLFDALQAAKDRKAAAPRPMPQNVEMQGSGAAEASWISEVPTGVWFALAGLLGVTIGGWTIYGYLNKGTAPNVAREDTVREAPASKNRISPPTASAPSTPAAAVPTRPVAPAIRAVAPPPPPAPSRPSAPIMTSPFNRISRPLSEPVARTPAAVERDERDRREAEEREREEAERRGEEHQDSDPIGDAGRDPAAARPSDPRNPDGPRTIEGGDPSAEPDQAANPDSSRID